MGDRAASLREAWANARMTRGLSYRACCPPVAVNRWRQSKRGFDSRRLHHFAQPYGFAGRNRSESFPSDSLRGSSGRADGDAVHRYKGIGSRLPTTSPRSSRQAQRHAHHRRVQRLSAVRVVAARPRADLGNRRCRGNRRPSRRHHAERRRGNARAAPLLVYPPTEGSAGTSRRRALTRRIRRPRSTPSCPRHPSCAPSPKTPTLC